MTDDAEVPDVEQTFLHLLSDFARGPQHAAEGGIADAAGLGGHRCASHRAQSQALTVTSDAIDDAQAAIDRATAALHDAAH